MDWYCIPNGWCAGKSRLAGAGTRLGQGGTQDNGIAPSRLDDTSEPFITNNGKFVAEDTGCFVITLDTFTHTLS